MYIYPTYPHIIRSPIYLYQHTHVLRNLLQTSNNVQMQTHIMQIWFTPTSVNFYLVIIIIITFTYTHTLEYYYTYLCLHAYNPNAYNICIYMATDTCMHITHISITSIYNNTTHANRNTYSSPFIYTTFIQNSTATHRPTTSLSSIRTPLYCMIKLPQESPMVTQSNRVETEQNRTP